MLHELDHLPAATNTSTFAGDRIPKEFVRRQVEDALRDFLQGRNPELGHSASDTRYSLDVDHLSEEIGSDLFAVSVLLVSTQKIMGQENGPAFRPSRLAHEVILMLNIFVAMEICRRTVRAVSTFPFDSVRAVRELLTPVAMLVRTHVLITFLATAFASMYSKGESAPERSLVDQWYNKLVEIWSDSSGAINSLESGQSRAMRQVLFPTEREIGLGNKLAKSMARPSGAIGRVDLNYFCRLAESFEISHPDIDYLRKMVTEPEPPPPIKQSYLVSWVHGPEGFESPFTLETRYGRVIFVFHENSEIFVNFHRVSGEWLESGFSLQISRITTEFEYDVLPLLINMVPVQLRRETVVAVEGGRRFGSWIHELAEGSIWND